MAEKNDDDKGVNPDYLVKEEDRIAGLIVERFRMGYGYGHADEDLKPLEVFETETDSIMRKAYARKIADLKTVILETCASYKKLQHEEYLWEIAELVRIMDKEIEMKREMEVWGDGGTIRSTSEDDVSIPDLKELFKKWWE